MKTVATALLCLFSLVTLFSAARADALGQPRIEPRMASPQPLLKGGDDKDDKKDDEEDEEEYRRLGPRAALELVDPGAREYVVRLRIAALRGP